MSKIGHLSLASPHKVIIKSYLINSESVIALDVLFEISILISFSVLIVYGFKP